VRFAVFTVSLPELTPETAVTVLREIGYEGIEWRVTDQTSSADGRPGFWAGNRCTLPLATFVEDAPRVREITERAGLAMPNIGTYAMCDELDAVERGMRGTAVLGAPSLRVRLPRFDGQHSFTPLWNNARSQFRDVEALARQYDVRALVETHNGTIFPSASAAARFLDDLDPRHVGVIHDAGNMVIEGYEQYRLGLDVLGPYLAHVQLKNCRWRVGGTRADGSDLWQTEWAPLTSGLVDIVALFQALDAVGYDDWISFEDFSTERPFRERIRDNLSYVQHVVSQLRVG
jgi:sugar phosphate isomerase/epimerase